MIIHLQLNKQNFKADLSKPLDISIPLRHGEANPRAWHAPYPDFSPVSEGNFTGSLEMGSPVNFYNVKLNPHGNGTHTESVAHISKTGKPINQSLKEYHFIAQVISVQPVSEKEGNAIKPGQIIPLINENANALIVRTLPNNIGKTQKDYSGQNPPYFEIPFLEHLRNSNIHHLLTDLPSIDPENDGGKVSGHKAFWGYPDRVQGNRSVTELIYVPDEIKDGLYLLNLQVPPFELDAAPSKPVLYELS